MVFRVPFWDKTNSKVKVLFGLIQLTHRQYMSIPHEVIVKIFRPF